MTVGRKLLVMLLTTALVPLIVSIFTTIRIHERAFEGQVAELHDKTAENGARTTEGSLDVARRAISSIARTIPWPALSDEERAGALWLVYEQLDDVAFASLFDARGAGVGPGAFRDDRSDHRHPAATLAGLEQFGRAVPFEAAIATGFGIAGPVGLDGDPFPAIVLAFAVEGRDGARWVLAAAISLRGLCRDLQATSPAHVSTRLVDGAEQTLCGSGATIRDGTDVLTASAPAPLGWRVVAAQPSDQAFAAAQRIRYQSIFWIVLGVVGALVAALLLGRSIRRPLAALTAAADALAGGRLGQRVEVPGRDELGVLGDAFNRMSVELERQDGEIRRWNGELQQRVDDQTRELRDAEEQLLESRKLAAVATLGAGVAHEINNPLAGVLGLTQVMLGRSALESRDRKALESIEREALRIREIVEQVAALSVARTGAAPVPVESTLDAAAASFGSRAADANVEIVREFGTRSGPVLGDAGQLERAFRQLIDNSLRAMSPGGGRLTMRTRLLGDQLIAIDIADTGRGMDAEVLDRIFDPFFTTKGEWSARGLGLAVAERIVVAHDGLIRAASRPGEGTTMTITLPVARQRAHLV